MTVVADSFKESVQGIATNPPAVSGLPFQYLAKGLANLLEIARREIDSDREAAKASLVAASHILKAEIERCSGANGSVRGGLAAWQILRVRAYVDNNLQRTIHIRDLSAVARRSPAHFSRRFKLAVGESPHAYVVRRRLEKACHLMITGTASLSEIALSVGFSDQAHLCRMFRQAFGQSPAMWRRERGIPDEVTPGTGVDEDVHERLRGNPEEWQRSGRVESVCAGDTACAGLSRAGQRAVSNAAVVRAVRFKSQQSNTSQSRQLSATCGPDRHSRD